MWKPWQLLCPLSMMGGEEYAKIGVGKSTGTKLISACGNINKPGVYEIDMTISVEDFIYSDEYCGGIAKREKTESLYTGRFFRAHSSRQSLTENSEGRKKTDEL